MAIRQPINPVNPSTLVSDINAALTIISQELNNCVPRTQQPTPPIQPGINDGPELLGTIDANNNDIVNVRQLSVTTLINNINGNLIDITSIVANAAASEAAAAASAANAAISEANAATSETNAAASAANAATSESTATAAANTAVTAATNAATSETNAAASAASAATSNTSATTAATTATNAAASASTSATNAATSATNAATSEANAAVSETNAAASAASAAASAASVGNPIPQSDKGIPNGVATLDGVGKVPNAQLPATALTQDIPLSQKGVAGGVATLDPTFGNVVEDIEVHDTRNTDTPTSLGKRALRADFKANATDGLSDGGAYHGVITLQQWQNAAGGSTHQIGLSDNGNLFTRVAAIGAATWGPWQPYLNAGLMGSTVLAYFTALETSAGIPTLLKPLVSANHGFVAFDAASGAITLARGVYFYRMHVVSSAQTINSHPARYVGFYSSAFTGATVVGNTSVEAYGQPSNDNIPGGGGRCDCYVSGFLRVTGGNATFYLYHNVSGYNFGTPTTYIGTGFFDITKLSGVTG